MIGGWKVQESFYGAWDKFPEIFSFLARLKSPLERFLGYFRGIWGSFVVQRPLIRCQTQLLRNARKLIISGWIPQSLGILSWKFELHNPSGRCFLNQNGYVANLVPICHDFWWAVANNRNPVYKGLKWPSELGLSESALRSTFTFLKSFKNGCLDDEGASNTPEIA